MLAGFIKSDLNVELRDIAVRALAQDEIRVRVEACGICGSDFYCGSEAGTPFGHEVAGTIIELGSAVGRLKIGDRVALESASACGVCDFCRDARQELCIALRSIFQNNPSMGVAETLIAPAISAIPYTGLTPAEACLQEPAGVAYDMVRLADLTPESRLLLIGPGPIGLMALELARSMGVRQVRVCGHAKRTGRYRLARKIGIDEWLEPDELASADFGTGAPDRILVTAPPAMIPHAVRVAAKGAIISYVGLGWSAEQANIPFDLDSFHVRKLQLRGSFASPALYGPAVLRALRDGRIQPAHYLTHRFPLAQAAEAVRTARFDPEAVKVVIENIQ